MSTQVSENWKRREAVALGFAMVLPSVVTLVYFVWAAESAAGLQQAAYAVMKTVQFVFPVAWVWIATGAAPRMPFSKTAGVGIGLAFGFLVLLATVLGFRYAFEPAGLFNAAIEPMRAKLLGLGLDSTGKFIAFAVFCSTVHALLEEYYWRWFVFGRMTGVMRPMKAAVVSSVGFMAHHVIVLAQYFGWASPTTWFFSFCVAVGGLFWAWLYRRSQSLLAPWLSHVLVDAGIFLVGYQICRSVL